MRKFLFSLALLFAALLFGHNVNASSFNASIIGSDTFENEVTLYVQVNNLIDFNGACNGLCGLVADLSYDKEKIELLSINALENFDLTQGNTLVLYKSTGVTNGTRILSMTFKNKTLSKNETTTISLSNIIASDGDKDISTTNVSKTIKFVVKEVDSNTQNNNSNTNTTTSHKNNSNKKEEKKKSNNNYLSSIILSNGKIEFDKDVLTYEVKVTYETDEIEIKANSENRKAIITGTGIHSLNVGSNVLKLTVNAEDGSDRVYTLNIVREEKEMLENDEIIRPEVNEKENNFIIPIVLVILIVGIVGFVIWKKRTKK